MDRGYDDSDAPRGLITTKGMRPCIPSRGNRKDPAGCDTELYKQRHHVESLFEKLKRFRRVATRYDKTAAIFHTLRAPRLLRSELTTPVLKHALETFRVVCDPTIAFRAKT